MNTLVITVADETLRNLEQKAESSGKSSAQVAAEVIEDVFGKEVNGNVLYLAKNEQEVIRERLREAGLLSFPESASIKVHTPSDPTDVRSILAAAGMIRPLGQSLLELIDDNVPTLDEVIEILSNTDGPSLTEILDAHRGPRL